MEEKTVIQAKWVKYTKSIFELCVRFHATVTFSPSSQFNFVGYIEYVYIHFDSQITVNTGQSFVLNPGDILTRIKENLQGDSRAMSFFVDFAAAVDSRYESFDMSHVTYHIFSKF